MTHDTTKPRFLGDDAMQSELKKVEVFIAHQLESEVPLLTEIAGYLFNLGGKRLRPLLVLQIARLLGQPTATEKLVAIAAGIELIHMATLLHDDIIDRSATRRSSISAYMHYGIEPTLLAGDFLLVKAFGICATLDSFVIGKTERACIELTEGELIEVRSTVSPALSLEQYFQIASKKTASLFSLACVTAAHLVGTNDSLSQQLEEFGKELGLVFQIIDDIIDINSSEEVLGKPLGTDLRQKTPSIVNILWLMEQPKAASDFFAIPTPSQDDCLAAIAEIKESGVILKAREIATSRAERAEYLLSNLDTEGSSLQLNTQSRDDLLAFLAYMLVRYF